jgi:hypothetical protein
MADELKRDEEEREEKKPSGFVGRIFATIQDYLDRRGFYDTEITPIDDRELDPEDDKSNLLSSRSSTPHTINSWIAPDVNKDAYQDEFGYQSRENRYRDFRQMIETPELEAGLHVYTDESTQADKDGNIVQIVSDNTKIKDMLERLFYHKLDINRDIWGIAFEMCWYGDAFREIILDKETQKEILKLKKLRPEEVERVEENGRIKNFLVGGKEIQPFRIVHFRNKSQRFDRYGASIFESGRTIWRQLKLLEDSLIIYRVTRSPERKIFYIDVGRLPADKWDAFVEQIKTKFQKKRQINITTGKIDTVPNVLSVNENYYIPRPEGRTGSTIEAMQGIQGIGEIDDVAYFKDKLMALLRIPRDYVSYTTNATAGGQGMSGKYLSEQDIRFSRIVGKIQDNLIDGLSKIATIFLALNGISPEETEQFEIKMTKSSAIEELRRIEVQTQIFTLIGSVKQLDMFPDIWILSNIMKMDDEEIQTIVHLMKVQKAQLSPDTLASLGASGLFPGEPLNTGGGMPTGGMPGGGDMGMPGGGGMPGGLPPGGDMGGGMPGAEAGAGAAPGGMPGAGGTPAAAGAAPPVAAMLNDMEKSIGDHDKSKDDELKRARERANELRREDVKKRMKIVRGKIQEAFKERDNLTESEFLERLETLNEEMGDLAEDSDTYNRIKTIGSDLIDFVSKKKNSVNEGVMIEFADEQIKELENDYYKEDDYFESDKKIDKATDMRKAYFNQLKEDVSMATRLVRSRNTGSILDALEEHFSFMQTKPKMSRKKNNYTRKLLIEGELRGKPQIVINEAIKSKKLLKMLNEDNKG